MKKTKEIKHDNLTHDQTLDIIKAWREQAANEYIDKYRHESRQKFCAACGKEFGHRPVYYYFGEKFHAVCVVKMKNGEKDL